MAMNEDTAKRFSAIINLLTSIGSTKSLTYRRQLLAWSELIKDTAEDMLFMNERIALSEAYVDRLFQSSGVRYEGLAYLNDLDAMHNLIQVNKHITEHTRNRLFNLLDRCFNHPKDRSGSYKYLKEILSVFKHARRTERNKERLLRFIDTAPRNLRDPESFAHDVALFVEIENASRPEYSIDPAKGKRIKFNNRDIHQQRGLYYNFINTEMTSVQSMQKLSNAAAAKKLEKLGISVNTFETLFPMGIRFSLHTQYRSMVISHPGMPPSKFEQFCRETDHLLKMRGHQIAYIDLIKLSSTAQEYISEVTLSKKEQP